MVTFSRYYYEEAGTSPSGSYAGGGGSGSFADEVLALNPVAYWRMGEASGNLADSSGNGYTLTTNGTPTYGQTGFTDSADSNDAIGFAANAAFSDGDEDDYDFGTGDFTLMVAVKMSDKGTWDADEQLMGHPGQGVAGEWWLRLDDYLTDLLTLRLADATSGSADYTFLTSSTPLDDGSWHLVVLACDRSGLAYCYVDGYEVDTTNISSSASYDVTNTGNLYIGARNTSGGTQYTGDLDEIAIFKGVVLSAAQVETLWNARNNA
jgi:hypothetical protein